MQVPKTELQVSKTEMQASEGEMQVRNPGSRRGRPALDLDKLFSNVSAELPSYLLLGWFGPLGGISF
jgi:hypothetical protein